MFDRYRIRRAFRLGKCAIYIPFLNPQIPHRGRNLQQTQLRNIAGGKAQGVDRAAGVEVGCVTEVLRLQIILRVNAAAGKKHICHAVLEGCSVFYLDIQIIQFFQKAVLTAIHKLIQIVGKVIVHGIARRRNEGVGKGSFVL